MRIRSQDTGVNPLAAMTKLPIVMRAQKVHASSARLHINKTNIKWRYFSLVKNDLGHTLMAKLAY